MVAGDEGQADVTGPGRGDLTTAPRSLRNQGPGCTSRRYRPRMQLVVPSFGRLKAGELHRYLQPSAKRLTVLDCRPVRWVEPAGLVALAVCAQHAVLSGRALRLMAPEDPKLARYMSRMRLPAVLNALGGQHDLPDVREHDTAGDLFELTEFTGARGAERLAGMVLDKVIATTGVEVATGLFRSICEVGQNVPHHSGVRTGFLAAQTTNYGRRVQFAVADGGKGMMPSLARHGAGSDATAIKLAVEQGLSETGEHHRGIGLQETRRLRRQPAPALRACCRYLLRRVKHA